MFSRTRVLGPRLTMFCLAFLLANCGPEESADTLHCIDNYVINAKLGETPIVPNLCSGATTALEQLWDPAKYQVEILQAPSNASLVGSDVTGQTQYVVKQGTDKEQTEAFKIRVTKLHTSCKDALMKDVYCSIELNFGVKFSVDAGLSVTIAGTPPSGIVPAAVPMVMLKAMPSGATAPSYQWERAKLIQSSPAVFETLGNSADQAADSLGHEPYLYRVAVTDSGRNAIAATVLRPQAFNASVSFRNFTSYPGTPFSIVLTSSQTASYTVVVQEPTGCTSGPLLAEDFAQMAASPDLQLNCSWVQREGPQKTKPESRASMASELFQINHSGVFRVVLTATTATDTVVVERTFFRSF